MECCRKLDILHLATQELQLRYGQANDALHQIRFALGYKSHLCRNGVRTAKSHRKKLGTFAQVAEIGSNVEAHAKIYNLARRAIVALDAPPDLLQKYQELKKSDLHVTTALVDPQAHGLGHISSTTLSWIWTIEMDDARHNEDWILECRLFII